MQDDKNNEKEFTEKYRKAIIKEKEEFEKWKNKKEDSDIVFNKKDNVTMHK